MILEALEDRVTPAQTAGSYAQLVADIAADTAPGTNYVIDITNSFAFPAGQQVTISTLGSGSTLTIEGQNGTNYTLTGNGNRLFDVTANQNVTFKDLTLTGGSGVAQGGAILDSGGNVALSKMTVETNAATGTGGTAAQGGGVFVSGGSLTVTDSILTKNTVTGGGFGNSQNASGGGVGASGASTVTIADSTVSGNTVTGGAGPAGAPSAAGGAGGTAAGGGVSVTGSGWTVTLKGDLVWKNSATGGNGGVGGTGAAATTPAGAGGVGGTGGAGGLATGGGLFAAGTGSLTIVNDAIAPMTHPSIFLSNTVTSGTSGAGGTGGAGGATGTGGAGGAGGNAGAAEGGGVALSNTAGQTLTANIGNTTFYANNANGGLGELGGPGGAGGTPGAPGARGSGGNALGGGLFLGLAGSGGVTTVNSTVAANIANGGLGSGGFANAAGGGIREEDATSDIFDNNTITLNTALPPGSGGGMSIASSNPTLLNNLIQGNGPDDLASTGTTPVPLPHATNNFITNPTPGNAVNPATNIVGDATPQLDAVVGLGLGNMPTGGPIYYPLLPGVISIGAGTTSVLGTILNIEKTNLATDEVGQLRTTNGLASGSISLGAVQPLAPFATPSNPLPTMVVPGNATINYYDSNPSPAFTISAAVNVPSNGAASGAALVVYLSSDNNNPPTFLGSAIVAANGTATINVPAGTLPPNLQPGNYDLIENFAGNASYAASSAIGTLTIATAPTTIVSGNATINYYGTSPSSAFTVPVGVNSPAGTVTGNVTVSLEAGPTLIPLTTAGGVALSNGTVDVSVPAGSLPANLQPGNYEIIETYLGNGQFASSSAIDTLTITTAPTSMVSGNATINFYGTSASPAFTFPLGVNSPAGTVTGNVTASIEAGSSLIALTPAGGVALTNGTADVSVPAGTLPGSLQPGTYEILETYLGNGQFASSSAIDTLTITTAPTTIVSGNASITYYGATPSPAFTMPLGVNSPAGTVTGNVTASIEAGSSLIALTPAGGVALTNGTADISVASGVLPPNLLPGTYQVVETYLGNGQFAGSSAIDTLTITIAPTTVVPGNVTVNFGSTAPFNVSAEVNSPDGTVNTGNVTFTLESGGTSTTLGTAAVTNGSAVLTVPAGTLPTGLQTGPYEIEEVYADVASGPFAGSGANGTLTVAAATTTIVPGNATVNFGNTSAFTLSAEVNSSNGTVNSGKVTFVLESGSTSTTLGTATVTNGDAVLTVPAGTLPTGLQTGKYDVEEIYADVTGGQFGGSGATGKLTIAAAPTSLVPGNVTVSFGGSPGFALSTEVNSPSGTVNSGNVTFVLETGTSSVTLGTAPVINGDAHLTVPAGILPMNLNYGKYDIEETYAGATGGQFAGGGATGFLTVAANPAPPTTVIPGNAVIGTNDPTVTIPVGVNSPNGPVNTGTVTISLVNGNTTMFLGSAPVVNGTANVTVTIPALAAGTYPLIETFSDSTGTFAGSTGMGTVTAMPLPRGIAALEMAIDAAALVSLNNPGAMQELMLFAQTFLHYQIPLSVPALIANIQTLFPKAGELGIPALAEAMFLANDLAQENPMTPNS